MHWLHASQTQMGETAHKRSSATALDSQFCPRGGKTSISTTAIGTQPREASLPQSGWRWLSQLLLSTGVIPHQRGSNRLCYDYQSASLPVRGRSFHLSHSWLELSWRGDPSLIRVKVAVSGTAVNHRLPPLGQKRLSPPCLNLDLARVLPLPPSGQRWPSSR